MSISSHPKDGLLLLLQAAKKLDEEESVRLNFHSEKWDKSFQRRSYDDNFNSCSHHYGSPRKPITTVRCTHNELEKSRRAHLRTCMEALKEHLNFDNDVPRITMLTVLKKATDTIRYLKQKNQCLENYEDSEKQRWAQLLKRRQALRKKLEEKRNRSIKLQSWKERNRNCLECSIATTSSDDSEMDQRSGSQSRINTPLSSTGPQLPITAASGLNTCITDQAYIIHASKSKTPTSPGILGSSPVGLDVFDASSSDSGFEEITIASTNVLPNDSSIAYCAADRQCSSAYQNNVCRAY